MGSIDQDSLRERRRTSRWTRVLWRAGQVCYASMARPPEHPRPAFHPPRSSAAARSMHVSFRLGWLSECSKDVLLFGLALCPCRARLSSLDWRCAWPAAIEPGGVQCHRVDIDHREIANFESREFPCSWKTTFLTKTVSRKRKRGRKSGRTEQNTLWRTCGEHVFTAGQRVSTVFFGNDLRTTLVFIKFRSTTMGTPWPKIRFCFSLSRVNYIGRALGPFSFQERALARPYKKERSEFSIVGVHSSGVEYSSGGCWRNT